MIIMLNIELSISITRKFVISFQTASLSELERKLFLLPVSAAILNLLYITGRTFTHIECARVSPFTVFMQSSIKVALWKSPPFWFSDYYFRLEVWKFILLHGWRGLAELNMLMYYSRGMRKDDEDHKGSTAPPSTFAWPTLACTWEC